MFEQLIVAGKVQRAQRQVGDPTTEAGHLRRQLIDGPKSTQELVALTGLDDKQIWGRLKHDIHMGRVVRTSDDKFELVEIDEEAIAQAIKLLRSNGYTVTRKKDK